jgi:hypothetical protein
VGLGVAGWQLVDVPTLALRFNHEARLRWNA